MHHDNLSGSLGVIGATPTLLFPKPLSRDGKFVSSVGEVRSGFTAVAGGGSSLFGSAGIGRFLKGSLEVGESVGRLRGALLLWESALPVPVLAGGDGEPLVTRASPTQRAQS